jgi:hypothetical protein
MEHRHIGTAALYCDVSDEAVRNAVQVGVSGNGNAVSERIGCFRGG